MTALARQYRMCKAIMELPNALVYSGQLTAGSEAVANAALDLPRPAALARHPAWLRGLLAPETRVAFLDTDGCDGGGGGGDGGGNSDSNSGACGEVGLRDGTANPGEARAAAALVAALLDCGVPGAEVAVVSPYRAQVQLLQRVIVDTVAAAAAASVSPNSDGSSNSGNDSGPITAACADDVEVMTVDRCQGRDKAVVVLSLVRSNAHGAAGLLLADWRRLNVAITRARVKLLILGSAGTVAAIPLLKALVRMAEEGGWLVKLPPEATQAEATEAEAAAAEPAGKEEEES